MFLLYLRRIILMPVKRYCHTYENILSHLRNFRLKLSIYLYSFSTNYFT